MQYCVSLCAAGLVLVFLKRRRMAGVFGVLALVNLALIVPLYFGRERAAAGPVVRAMLINVNQRMGDPRRVAGVIGEVDPDLVVLEEVSGKWMRDLAATIARYPYTRLEPREDNFGIALLSRFPLVESRVVMIGDAGVPSIVAEVQTPQGRCTVVATHPFPPVNAECSAYRNGQLAGLRRRRGRRHRRWYCWAI